MRFSALTTSQKPNSLGGTVQMWAPRQSHHTPEETLSVRAPFEELLRCFGFRWDSCWDYALETDHFTDAGSWRFALCRWNGPVYLLFYNSNKLVSGRPSCSTGRDLQCMRSPRGWGCFSAHPPPESVKQWLEELHCPLLWTRELNHTTRLDISQPSHCFPFCFLMSHAVVNKLHQKAPFLFTSAVSILCPASPMETKGGVQVWWPPDWRHWWHQRGSCGWAVMALRGEGFQFLLNANFRDDADIITNKYVIGEVGRLVPGRRISPIRCSLSIGTRLFLGKNE